MIIRHRMRAFAVSLAGLVALAGGIAPSVRAEQGAKAPPVSSLSPSKAGAQRVQVETALREAVKQLREAVGDEAQQEAKGRLVAAVTHYFDADLESRNRQLADIASRLTKLQGELDRRLAAKDEIIHLQLKAMEKEDAGLGRYGQEQMSRLLANFFDADMKNRQRELADLESRVQKLHAQVDKREAARDAIIQLQVNVLVHEAAGLGFSTVLQDSE
jgi:hypothetical protein